MSNPMLPQRPLGWTSADAAGLPIQPLLAKVGFGLWCMGCLLTALVWTRRGRLTPTL